MSTQPSSASEQLNLSVISTALQSRLPFSGELEECQKLPGDASNRRYYRLKIAKAPVSSIILMQLADPEGFKASEEAVSRGGNEITELPFLNVLKHLQTCEIPVPSLYYYDEPGGLLYLQDFGDRTLAQTCQDISSHELQKFYFQAIDQLVLLHLRASQPSGSDCLAFTRSFDVPLYMWEFDHFLEYGIVARQGRPMCSGDWNFVREEFQKIAEWLAVQPTVFTHRDYHSRNLMVYEEQLGVIDFQDALLGPVTYDLASLLRDSYMTLDERLIDRMIDRYINGMQEGLPEIQAERFLLHDPQTFRRLFDYSSIQRNLKAAGRFVYIDRVKKNPNFLASIPRTLRNVRANLEKYPELHPLLTCLKPYISEWKE